MMQNEEIFYTRFLGLLGPVGSSASVFFHFNFCQFVSFDDAKMLH